MVQDKNINLPAVPWEGYTRMPDPGVMAYVNDMLSNLGVDVEAIAKDHPHWFPVGIMGTLDWIQICGWWIWRNTGFLDTGEAYKVVIEFDGYEFDSDQLLVFRERAERNKFFERMNTPGIDGKERSEAIGWLVHDMYGGWAKSEGVDPREFTPPQEFIEMVMWATFLWVLSSYGRDWIYTQDIVLACVIEHSVAFVEKWSPNKALLDPALVTVTDRPISSCRDCGKELWCVRGAFVEGELWFRLCNNCLVSRWEAGKTVDLEDGRITHPRCPHKEGRNGSTRSCLATCPHSKVTEESVWQKFEDVGSQRVEAYRESMRMSGGTNHRALAGQSLEDIQNHFRKEEP